MINNNIVDEAFDFYNINSKYKKQCYDCIKEINDSNTYINELNRVYKQLYCDDFLKIRKLWDITNINEIINANINPFVTNIIIILGYQLHKNNMKKYNFDDEQIKIHKKRVKECFENDLYQRNYPNVRVSQMLWAIYFIRCRIIEIGRLQFEYYGLEDETAVIKIHVPKGNKLDILEVIKSLKISENKLNGVFKINNLIYKCDSWLLSKQICSLLEENSNIYKFSKLFSVKDGNDCIKDILNFVFSVESCDDYSSLPENTKLQRLIKKSLINGTEFKLGLGVLREKVII